MKKLSTGQPSTLGVYRDLSALVFGAESKAVAFLDEKIAKEGRESEVIADESQMLGLLAGIDERTSS